MPLSSRSATCGAPRTAGALGTRVQRAQPGLRGSLTRWLATRWVVGERTAFRRRALSQTATTQRGRLVLLGGLATNQQLMADVWESDDEGRTWSIVQPSAAFGGRAALGLVALTVRMSGWFAHKLNDSIVTRASTRRATASFSQAGCLLSTTLWRTPRFGPRAMVVGCGRQPRWPKQRPSARDYCLPLWSSRYLRRLMSIQVTELCV